MAEKDVYGPDRRWPHAVEHFVDKKTGEVELSLTKQEMTDDTDINKILAKARQGIPPDHFALQEAIYGQFENVGDYQAQMNRVIQAREAFEALSSKIRNRFANQPGKLLEFMDDPSNHDEGVELGIYPAPPEPEPEVKTTTEPITVTELIDAVTETS